VAAPPFAPQSPAFAGQTVRQVVRLSAGGSQVRIRLTNEFGSAPLHIGGAHLAMAAAGGAIQPGSDHVLTFGGSPEAVIPPGAPLLSDPVDWSLPPLASLAVSLYLPDDTGPCTCHQVGAQTGFISGPGDFTAAVQFPTASTFLYRTFLSGVEVRAEHAGGSIVILGDSISDGAVSTPDLNHRWPDRLAERLAARDGAGRAWGVANQGISGNRLLLDGAGPGALARFDRDVLGVAGARYVVVFLGVNDLGVGYGPATPQRPAPLHPPTAQAMIAAYRQLIARAHEHGLKIYGATITPYQGASYWSPAGDAVRRQINDWMLTGRAFDGVIDFDAAWRDPAQPGQIRDGFHAADHLHGSDDGYRALGDAVPLDLFR
jgi:lysophospholipase L1-like esterase